MEIIYSKEGLMIPLLEKSCPTMIRESYNVKPVYIGLLVHGSGIISMEVWAIRLNITYPIQDVVQSICIEFGVPNRSEKYVYCLWTDVESPQVLRGSQSHLLLLLKKRAKLIESLNIMA